MVSFVLLLFGFVPLLYGANLFVKGASSLARIFQVPPMVVGLTLVAFGTSAPEMVVSVAASLQGQDQIAIGNVAGSNIFNILGVLGPLAIIRALPITRRTTWIEIPLALLASVALFATASDALIEGTVSSEISRIDGILLLLFFFIFIAYILSLLRQEKEPLETVEPTWSASRAVFASLGGLILLIAGGRLVVDSAVKVAQILQVPPRVIAVTVVAIGTSLPELVTSIVATIRGEVDLAVGNIIGSNIFNTFLVISISAIVHPLRPAGEGGYDLMINVVITVLVFLFVFTGRGRMIHRWEGVVLTSGYAGYIAFLLLRM